MRGPGGQAAGLAAAVILITISMAPAAQSALPEGNLLRNAGAEDGAGAQDTSTIVAPPEWTTTGSLTAVAYGTQGTLGSGQRPSDAGANFFAGGEGSEIARGYQTIDVAGNTQEIDACRVTATARGYFGGFEAQGDRAGADVTFFGGDGEVINVFQTGYPTAADRNNTSGYLAYEQTGRVPGGTRAIRFTVTAQRTDGTYNDGYADNLSLTLAATEPPAGGTSDPVPVSGQSVVLRRVRGTVVFSYTITIFFPGGPCALSQEDVQRLVDAIAVLLPGRPVIDATNGEVELTAAKDSSGGTQTGRFSKGAFRIVQKPAAEPLTELVMTGGSPSRCSQKRNARRRVVRQLFGNGRGRFRTRGRHSTATIRGTRWVVKETCAGTLTVSQKGTVVVRDLVKHRTRTLHTGERYLARPR
jgi:hypothetical protein